MVVVPVGVVAREMVVEVVEEANEVVVWVEKVRWR